MLRIILGKGAHTFVLALSLEEIKLSDSQLYASFLEVSAQLFFNNCIEETMWVFPPNPYPFLSSFDARRSVSDQVNASSVCGVESESGALRPNLQQLTLHRPLNLNPFTSNGFRAAE